MPYPGGQAFGKRPIARLALGELRLARFQLRHVGGEARHAAASRPLLGHPEPSTAGIGPVDRPAIGTGLQRGAFGHGGLDGLGRQRPARRLADEIGVSDRAFQPAERRFVQFGIAVVPRHEPIVLVVERVGGRRDLHALEQKVPFLQRPMQPSLLLAPPAQARRPKGRRGGGHEGCPAEQPRQSFTGVSRTAMPKPTRRTAAAIAAAALPRAPMRPDLFPSA